VPNVPLTPAGALTVPPELTVSGGQKPRHPPVQVTPFSGSEERVYRACPFGPVRYFPRVALVLMPSWTLEAAATARVLQARAAPTSRMDTRTRGCANRRARTDPSMS
jgi:hypothetical protein